jgi:hypothetical protein
MPVTLGWVDFRAHKSDGMFDALEESVQIVAEVWSDNMLVVPIPDDIATAGVNSLSANVARHAQLTEVDVFQAPRVY